MQIWPTVIEHQIGLAPRVYLVWRDKADSRVGLAARPAGETREGNVPISLNCWCDNSSYGVYVSHAEITGCFKVLGKCNALSRISSQHRGEPGRSVELRASPASLTPLRGFNGWGIGALWM